MKTAVERLVEEINKLTGLTIAMDEPCVEKAKVMEKEQISQAFEDGEHNYFYSKKTGEDFENGIEYYNEKFKKDEQ
jgi:hypothetical protein